jgi:PAS domain S-box-containing protein
LDTPFTSELAFSGNAHLLDLGLLTMALDASLTGVTISDNTQADNPIVYCNQAFMDMTGYAEHEIIGRNCRFLQNDDRSQASRKSIRQAINSGIKFTAEVRNYRKNGDLFWNELHICPIKDDSGKVTHFIGIQKDISKEKKAEQLLRAQKAQIEAEVEERTRLLKDSEAFLFSIFQTVKVSLLVLDPKLTILSANEQFYNTFKVSAEETLGKQLSELGNHQWDFPVLNSILNNVLLTNHPVENFEVDHEFPHIGRKLMLLNAHSIELSGQYKDQILLAFEDITLKREAEIRKDDFLTVASHEFKTPLTSIKGYIQTIERLIPPGPFEKIRLILKKATLQVERLNNMISELLEASRMKTGNLPLHKAWFDFDAMVQETAELTQANSTQPTIVIEGRCGVQVLGDESHIVQVLTNLLSNAIKYAPKSDKILIMVSRVSNYVKVSVKDDGLGISAADQKRVFERFYRVEGVQHKFPGMGMGLYICAEIVKNHGGSLWVESEEGYGSTFSFTLPIGEQK